MDNEKLVQGLIGAAVITAKKAGIAIIEIYSKDFTVEFKKDLSPLTLADKVSHELIVSGLSTLAPIQLPILSEEGKNITYEERKDWEYFWLVDPLDGTKEFIKKNGEFTVNIALIRKDRPVIGVVYIPARDVLYYAGEGLGAYKLEGCKDIDFSIDSNQYKPAFDIINQSKKLSACNSTLQTKSQIVVIGSRSHSDKEFDAFLEEISGQYEKIELITAGSSLKFCLLAEGIADIYPRFGSTMEWDTAAGQAIVEQTDGKVLNARLRLPLTYNKRNLTNSSFFAVTAQAASRNNCYNSCNFLSVSRE